MIEDLSKYEQLLENLRTRLNVINTSIFLLEDNLSESTTDMQTGNYIKRINTELERIRALLNDVPEREIARKSSS